MDHPSMVLFRIILVTDPKSSIQMVTIIPTPTIINRGSLTQIVMIIVVNWYPFMVLPTEHLQYQSPTISILTIISSSRKRLASHQSHLMSSLTRLNFPPPSVHQYFALIPPTPPNLDPLNLTPPALTPLTPLNLILNLNLTPLNFTSHFLNPVDLTPPDLTPLDLT